jgi:hypothetical protein
LGRFFKTISGHLVVVADVAQDLGGRGHADALLVAQLVQPALLRLKKSSEMNIMITYF